MRLSHAIALAVTAAFAAGPAAAVTVINAGDAAVHVFVCDDQCGPSFGDSWGSARDVWLQPGASQSYDCQGQCFIGLYNGEDSPTLGDMAMADEDELFKGDETAYIQDGLVSHTRK
jgi:hypothetical protein